VSRGWNETGRSCAVGEMRTRNPTHEFLTSPHTSDLRKVLAQELRKRTGEILRHLSEWLLSKSDGDIERRYCNTRRESAT